MPKATSKSVHVSYTSANQSLEDLSNSQEPPSENEFQEDFNTLHDSSSDEEIVLKRSQPKPSTSQAQAIQKVYMPYIEGHQMDWTVNDHVYKRFISRRSNVKIYLSVN